MRIRLMLILPLALILMGCSRVMQARGQARIWVDQTFLCDADYLSGPPAWSPDGQRVAYRLAEGNSTAMIAITDVVTGESVTVEGTTGGFYAVWSPDGKNLLVNAGNVGSGASLLMVDAATYKTTPLLSSGSDMVWPDWSPDGQSIIYQMSDAPGSWKIVVSDPDGQNEQVVSTPGILASSPSWSPDGSKIAFLVIDPQQGAQGIADVIIANPDGSDASTVPFGEMIVSGALWSPNERWIAVVTNDSTGRLRLITADSQTGASQMVVDGVLFPVTWLPGEETLMYVDVKGNLVTVSADGSKTGTLLTGWADSNSDASISPDGSKIAYISSKRGYSELYVMETATGDITRLTSNPGNQLCVK